MAFNLKNLDYSTCKLKNLDLDYDFTGKHLMFIEIVKLVSIKIIYLIKLVDSSTKLTTKLKN